ncbi:MULTISPECIES: M48 family metalloprotease [unclassified Treponema]|uniref:M48 family metalloprotease n=1 Tax=unclassified Treponema TaxID=2638727 RepID=UPI0020A5D492|nr:MULTISPECIES: M48 family metalloprotease [unclassified Treponema]UTC66919.1 M48 family metalloprotease [Treponema sp. OMZ 789]UTC69648.1 M48 family metalloprotease [Treponema sp. OMZ 790]UTC72362.1 M48 family metalloprotease [Treponema sp. OMZ 791]
MKKKFALVLIIIFIPVIALSCALLESLKDPHTFTKTVVDAASPIVEASKPIQNEEEYYIGREVAAVILSNYKLYRNKQLEKYLNLICMTLVLNSDVPESYNGYHVAILDTDEINAFATPGGHVLVTKGLLACTDSEDALAGVIAHELGHIQLKHGIGAIKANRITGAVVESSASITMGSGKNENLKFLEDASKEIVTTLVNSGYSKTQEYDADRFAVNLMAKSGYDPNAMTEMLKIMGEKQKNDHRGFGKTHPSAASRIRYVEREARKFSGNYNRSARLERYAENKLK